MIFSLALALALVLVLEGLLYATAPRAMKDMMARLATVPDESLRAAGLAATGFGVLMVWLLRVMFA
jgi:uncharacterized protein